MRAWSNRRILFPVSFPAHIAQSVEHFLGKEEVTGSTPVVGSMVEGPRRNGRVEFLIYI